MIPTFLTALPKFVLVLLATTAVTGGAVGVSAAVGGPNLPAQAMHAAGLRVDRSQDKRIAIEASPAMGSAAAAGFLGLCRAEQSGSARGQAQKQDSAGFERLQQAAKTAGQTVAQFCAPILSSSGKDDQNQQHGAMAMATAADAITIRVGQIASIGGVLVDSKGMTLYIFKNDTTGNGKSVCNGACATNWPALKASSGGSSKAAGIAGDLAVISRDDGTRQVTYKGLPLYYFATDQAAGDAKGAAVTNWAVALP